MRVTEPETVPSDMESMNFHIHTGSGLMRLDIRYTNGDTTSSRLCIAINMLPDGRLSYMY